MGICMALGIEFTVRRAAFPPFIVQRRMLAKVSFYLLPDPIILGRKRSVIVCQQAGMAGVVVNLRWTVLRAV